MPERILVTGSTGTTGGLLATLLRDRGVDVAAATRRPTSGDQVRLDWSDPATFTSALSGCDSVYLVAPTDRVDQMAAMRPFLEHAVERLPGVLVLLSAASLPAGGPMMGTVHAWLRDHAPRWAVLRPSWFMQNFTGQHLPSILSDGCLYSATGDGRVAFIDAVDIAAVAAAALLVPERASGELLLTGPQALTYDEVAAMIGHMAGRDVRHCRLSILALTERYVSFGLPLDYATLLANMDEAIAHGAEDRVTDVVEKTIGRRPTTLQAFLKRTAERF